MTGPALTSKTKLSKAYQRLDIEAIAALRLAPGVERETEAALRDFVTHCSPSATPRSLAFLDEVRVPHRDRPSASGWGRGHPVVIGVVEHPFR